MKSREKVQDKESTAWSVPRIENERKYICIFYPAK